MLANAKSKSFLGKRIVVFTAHPDDEMIAAGTMFANHRAGGETFLICATYGEKGKSHLAKPVSDAALKKIRRAELLHAAKILKIDDVIFLGLPDASVRENAKKLYEKSLPVVTKLAPDYMLSFGPDGMSAHWDHITVGKIALRIAKKLKIPMAAFTVSPKFRKRRLEGFLKRRTFGKYKGIPEHRPGDIKIKVDMAVKMRAMKSHGSQFGNGSGVVARGAGPFGKLPKSAAQKMFGYEHFVKEKFKASAAHAKSFKQKVYDIVAQIPRGKTMSYQEVALRAGSPRAYRAVGNIMNKNPDTKRVPCHRVVPSSFSKDGNPGGYARGHAAKIALLKKEGAMK